MLAEDEIRIEIGRGQNREIVFLRPTLRAAMRLERSSGGYENLVQAILNENVTAMASVIREGEDDRSNIPDLIESLAGMPLYAGVESLKEPLVRFVMQLATIDSGDDADKSRKGETITLGEHYRRLFGIATGWLGWTPEVAWTSTPSEITHAVKGRVEMLKAIFGSGETAPAEEEQSPEVFNSKLSAILAMASARHAKVPA